MTQGSSDDGLDDRKDILDAMVEFIDDRSQPPLEADANLDLAAEPQGVVGNVAEQPADDDGQRQPDAANNNRHPLRTLHGIGFGVVTQRPVAAAKHDGALNRWSFRSN